MRSSKWTHIFFILYMLWSIFLFIIDILARNKYITQLPDIKNTYEVANVKNQFLIRQVNQKENQCLSSSNCQCLAFNTIDEANKNYQILKSMFTQVAAVCIPIAEGILVYAKLTFKSNTRESEQRKDLWLSRFLDLGQVIGLYGLNRTFSFYTDTCIGFDYQFTFRFVETVAVSMGILVSGSLIMMCCGLRHSSSSAKQYYVLIVGILAALMIGTFYSVYTLISVRKFGYWEIKLVLGAISLQILNDMSTKQSDYCNFLGYKASGKQSKQVAPEPASEVTIEVISE